MKFAKIFKGNNLLYIILGVAALALLLGFLVVRKRINTPAASQGQQEQTQKASEDKQPETDVPKKDAVVPTSWPVYTNDKYSFSVSYPPSLQAGAVSKNSVLGTYQVPVRGFHVGPLVFVVLKDSALKQDAQDYFNASYDLALHPQPSEPGSPSVSCKGESITTQIKSVSCSGEGGDAKYAYIKGTDFDVFVDGYSKGYDKQDYGSFQTDTDYDAILSSFKFATTNSNSTTTTSTDSTTPPGIQTFSISTDDNTATPSSISVPKGTIVEITFTVAPSNVFGAGLDFRSSVVNSGTIPAGQSKTISFTADQSFNFTPFWPASNIAKNYKINVVVQ